MEEIIADSYPTPQGFTRTLQTRFWKKVNKLGPTSISNPELGPCWIWTKWKDKDAYGAIGRGMPGRGSIRAHRASWIMAFGQIPIGLNVLHKCDNPSCVNPDHLWVGTTLQNNEDRNNKKRTARQCGEKHGMSRLSELDVILIRTLKGTKSHKEIARIFGINPNYVSLIVTGRRWKHLNAQP